MFLIILMYFLMASTFTIGKAVLAMVPPVFIIGCRMLIAGCVLLAYLLLKKPDSFVLKRADWFLYLQIILFHIYIAYVFEFWGLQQTTSSKVCFLYNFSPFITALLAYFLIGERLNKGKWIGLIVGFLGMLPLFYVQLDPACPTSGLFFVSWADIAVLISVISSAYGWMLMKKLVNLHGYSPLMVNGIAMIGGGLLALGTSAVFEGFPPHINWLSMASNPVATTLLFIGFYTFLLILIGNIIGYNLYGYLLRIHSATWLSFMGFTTPFFTALLSWFFLGEVISWHFWLSLVITGVGLYLFYQEELS